MSNIQIMNGSSRNISAPLMRCRIETQPAGGSRYDDELGDVDVAIDRLPLQRLFFEGA